MEPSALASHIVIGSGPAGISCAMALIQRNLNVIMVDAGYQLDENILSIVQDLQTLAPESWPAEHIDKIKNPVQVSPRKVTQKLFFGSRHVFGDPAQKFSGKYENFSGDFSFAEGGLSTVWGAAMLPALESETKDWPFSVKDLEPYYKAVLKFVPLAAESDDLERLFPLCTSIFGNLKRAPQSRQFLEHAKLCAEAQKKAGFTVGAARLAIYTSAGERDCRYCGLCVFGCPYGSIYSSIATLDQLKKHSKFTYLRGRIALSFSESLSQVSLKVLNVEEGSEDEIKGVQLYLALGSLSTARLVLESANATNHPLKVLDNQMFLFPFFSFKKCKEASMEKGVTLTQVFLELYQESLGSHLIHFQSYAMSDVIVKALERMVPRFLLRSRFFKEEILSRISIMQGFLHSDDSAGATLILKRTSNSTQLQVEGRKSKKVQRHIRKILFYIFRKSRFLGGMIIPGFAIKGRPGGSHHVGGILPMAKDPGHFQCDLNGKLYGYSRVQVVDASALPSLPASTITFTVMANAYRVGSISSET